MKIAGIAAAYREARERAANYGADLGGEIEDCEAAAAWARLATRPRTRTAPPWAFADAIEDARASEDPDLITAVEKIAAHQILIAQGREAYTEADEILAAFA